LGTNPGPCPFADGQVYVKKEPKKLILDVTGPGEIKAKDIQPNPEVNILNPDSFG
jgi:DNA-directed RNA polymerase alpha subunit